jgi:hypothetical protein
MLLMENKVISRTTGQGKAPQIKSADFPQLMSLTTFAGASTNLLIEHRLAY